MTLWIGLDYIDNRYIIVGMEQYQVKFMRRLNVHELTDDFVCNLPGIWVVKIPSHAIKFQNITSHINSNLKNCQNIIKQKYGNEYDRYEFRFFYLGQQDQQDVWVAARISLDYLQEYMIRYVPVAKKIQLIESDLIAIWLWIYSQFKEERLGAVIYQQGIQVQAIIGKNELILHQFFDCHIDKLIQKIDMSAFKVKWICFFNVPSQAFPNYEIKLLKMDIVWRMAHALAYRGACFGL